MSSPHRKYERIVCAIFSGPILFLILGFVWFVAFVEDSRDRQDPNTLYKRVFNDYKNTDHPFGYDVDSVSMPWYPPEDEWGHFKRRKCFCAYKEEFDEVKGASAEPARAVSKSCRCSYN